MVYLVLFHSMLVVTQFCKGGVKMKNWKTTLVGVIGAFANGAYAIMNTGVLDVKTIIMSAFMVALGFLAKDLDV